MIGGRRVREYRQVTLAGFLFSVIVWVIGVAVVGGLLVAAWPLVIAAGCGFVLAWWRGWPARRLAAGAACCVPMLAAFALAYGLRGGSWQVAAWSPFRAWQHAWHDVLHGSWLRAMVVIAPTAIPAGLLVAGFWWRLRVGLMAAGAAGWWPGAPVAFDERQWRRQVAGAGQRVRAPGGVPVLSRRGAPVLGAVIRAVGHRPRPLLALPYGSLRTHMLIVGTTGAGKTTLLIRLWACFWAAALRRYRRGREARPWLVGIDAKGGYDSRDTAYKARAVLRDLGVQKFGIWPDEVSLNLWALPPGRLVEVLCDLVPVASEGAAAYYADVLASIVALAVSAPAGPPANSAEFLSRLDAGWLAQAYAGSQDRAGDVAAARAHAGDVRLRYRSLFTRLGPGFDGDARVTDFDVLYCIVEGTASTAVGEAQARALVELVTEAASTWTGEDRRAGLLALDEFSAVAGRVPVHELTERCRSLGLAVQVAAQSWESLAPEESQRARLASTAAGGVLVMRSPDPENLCTLAGTRPVIEIGRKIVGPGQYGEEGTGRLQAQAEHPVEVSESRALACDLFAQSRFESSPESRFLTLVTALEVLSERRERSGVAARLVEEFRDAIKDAARKADSEERKQLNSLLGSTKDLRCVSIGAAIRELAESVPASEMMGDTKAGDLARGCYEVRSELTHGGVTSADLTALLGPLEGMVSYLCTAASGPESGPDGCG